MPDKQAQTNLRVTLNRLRRSLRPAMGAAGERPLLEITRQTAQLNLDGAQCRVDTAVFRETLAACDARPPGDWWRWADRIPHLQEAADLYRGEFLAGLYLADSPEFDAWRLAQADWFYRRAASVQEALARRNLALGRCEAAITYARRLLDAEPWREMPHRLIMRAHAAMGQPEMALRQFAQCRQILDEELGARPDSKTRALAEEIERGAAAPRPLFPPELTPFVGREAELLWLKARLIDPEHRLLTLAGPGGMGKTRLAQTAAAGMTPYFADGVCFVSLAEAGRPAEAAQAVLSALAAGLGLTGEAGRPLAEQIAEFLSGRELLLILDNFEEMATAVGLLLDLLAASPRSTFLITSRTRLNCPEETAFYLEGLAAPPPDAGVGAADYPAARLFLACGARYLPGFQPGEADWAAIGALCRLTGGLPLALLLAATWVEAFSCAEIVAAVRRNIKLQAQRDTGILPRQRSMAAVFEHSWAQLSPEEQAALACLSLFAGEFGREVAAAVAQLFPSTLGVLTARCMIQSAGQGWYVFHPLLRQMAAEKLGQMAAAAEAAAGRYIAWYANFLQARQAELDGAAQLAALNTLRREAANAQQAWRLALEGGNVTAAAQMAAPLAAFYDDSGQYEAGLALFTAAQQDLAAAGRRESRAYGLVLLYLAQFLERAQRYEAAMTVLQEMLADTAALSDEPLKAEGHYRLGCSLMCTGELEAALRHLEEAELYFSRLESSRGMSMVFSAQGGVLRKLGRYEEARQKMEWSMQLRRETGSPRMLAVGLHNLAFLLIRLGEYNTAVTLLRECLALERQLAHLPAVSETLIHLGLAYANQAAWPEARECVAEALALARQLENREVEAICLNNLGDIANSQGAHAEAAQYLADSLAIKRGMNNVPGIVFSLLHLGRAYLGLGRRKKARETLLQAEGQAEKLALRPLWLACQVEIARLLLVEGAPEEAARRLTLAQNDAAAWARTRREAAQALRQMSFPE